MRLSSAFALSLAAAAPALLAGGCGSSGSPHRAAGTSTEHTLTSSGIKVPSRPRFATPNPSEPLRSGLVEVEYHLITIHPDTLRVKVGSTIRWRNLDQVQHTVTSEGGPQRFSSTRLRPGQTFSIKVTRPGVIDYECTIHPTTMNGAIEVVS